MSGRCYGGSMLQSHFDARRSGGRLSGQRVRIPANAARICKLARYATYGAGCASPFERTVAPENSGDPVFPGTDLWRAVPVTRPPVTTEEATR